MSRLSKLCQAIETLASEGLELSPEQEAQICNVSTNIPNDRKKYYPEAIAKDLGIEIQVMLVD